jgi:hypothetical protein
MNIAIVIFIIFLLIIFIVYLVHSRNIKKDYPKGEVIRPEETFAIMTGSNFNRSKVFYVNGKESPVLYLKKGYYYEFFGEKDLYFSEKPDDPTTKIKHISHSEHHAIFLYANKKRTFYYNHKIKSGMGGKIIVE